MAMMSLELMLHSPPALIPSSIIVGIYQPWGIDYDPVNTEMYVTNFGSDNVIRIDTTQITPIVIGTAITVGNGRTDITYDPDLRRMYVTNFTGNSVTVIDTITNTVYNHNFRPRILQSSICNL